jgi:hypothetical protein
MEALMRIAIVCAVFGALLWTGAAKAQTTITDISFDRFCDGMTITVNDQLLAVEVRTGCFTGIGTGAVARGTFMDRKGKWLIVQAIASDQQGKSVTYIIQYPLVDGGLWESFQTKDGKTIRLLHVNQTYSLGTPSAAPRANAPSSSGD